MIIIIMIIIIIWIEYENKDEHTSKNNLDFAVIRFLLTSVCSSFIEGSPRSC